ncbi:MAG: lysylphosphatidylglycerol synthase transmembrane domain-containing protein [Lachnospiraceae bacterium]|nr:lysylphosphatidylglycerol synthase transmembrane domain-containing protein [Lachnospiraceae bacterium]
MSSKKKVFLNGALFIGIFALTFWGVFHGQNPGELREAIEGCQGVWLLPAAFCVFVFIWGESVIIWHMLDTYGIRIRKRLCFLFSSVGFFFSCVTPSASGGQPMQIYFMKKEKVPVPVATVVLMIVTIIYKLVLVVIGVGIMVFARDFEARYLSEILPVFYLGVALNVFCVSSMILLVFHPFLAKKILVKGVHILERMHLLRHREGRLAKLESSMDLYNETASFMRDHIGLMLRVFLITFAQRTALFAVTCFIYRAFGLSGTGWMTILVLQAVISVSVDMLPLPGGMGISESLFMIIFEPVFGALLLPGMIVSRGMGYYSELLISALFTLMAVAVFGYREKRKQKKN